MSQKFRNLTGGRISRDTPLNFQFNGVRFQGYQGDTLASALLANGVRLIGRSFKYHRPRGVFSAGTEEPSALVQLGSGPLAEPNTRATRIELTANLEAFSQNCWPSVNLDLMSINNTLSPFLPAGFYYKTFMSPRRLWPWYEKMIRKAAGMGTAPRVADPDHYLCSYAHCDVLVVGAGPSGLMSARAAASTGASVMLVDENPAPGGSLQRERISLDGMTAASWAESTWQELAELPNVTVRARATALGYYDHNLLAIREHIPAGTDKDLPRQRLWRVRAKRVVLATGAIERPLVFANNDRPGIMLAGAARAYANQYAVRAGSRAVVATNNNSGYLTAVDLADSGIAVAAVMDSRSNVNHQLLGMMEERGIPVDMGHTVHDTRGSKTLAAVRTGATTITGGSHWIDCDLLAVSGGWAPAIHLHAQSGARPVYSPQIEAFVPGPCKQAEQTIGAARGNYELDQCLNEGLRAGMEAARLAGFESPGENPLQAPESNGDHPHYEQEAFWQAPRPNNRAKQFVDIQDDVTTLDIELAHREGYVSVEHLKRYTTLGMGTDQGKTSNINGMALLAKLRQEPIPDVGTTTFRPPYTPVTLGALAGSETGARIKPTRYTPMHAQHQALGAVFAPLGLWTRPQGYPRSGETMHQCVQREARAVRSEVGLTDISTLGKILLQGPDTGEFLNRIYINQFSSLKTGRARYGLMLREDGMIFDDGTVTRLSEDRYFMTCTSGNADEVIRHLEYHLEVCWPELDVELCEVTEQWAAVALAGPLSRSVLQGLCPEGVLDASQLPAMGAIDTQVGEIPARIIRISFSGELAFEIYVPSSRGAALWEALLGAPGHAQVTPYGMDALELLRIEKGFIGMGTEADGRTTAKDLGLHAMLSKKKWFVGQLALQRPGLDHADRLKLVGLSPVSPGDQLAEGAQVLASPVATGPGCSIGHVSSSTHSVVTGTSIALALVKGGNLRSGDTVFLADPARGASNTVPARVTSPCFYDPEGERLNG